MCNYLSILSKIFYMEGLESQLFFVVMRWLRSRAEIHSRGFLKIAKEEWKKIVDSLNVNVGEEWIELENKNALLSLFHAF